MAIWTKCWKYTRAASYWNAATLKRTRCSKSLSEYKPNNKTAPGPNELTAVVVFRDLLLILTSVRIWKPRMRIVFVLCIKCLNLDSIPTPPPGSGERHDAEHAPGLSLEPGRPHQDWGQNKMADALQRKFPKAILEWKLLIFYSNLTFHASDWRMSVIGSDNGLVPISQQTFVWTNDIDTITSLNWANVLFFCVQSSCCINVVCSYPFIDTCWTHFILPIALIGDTNKGQYWTGCGLLPDGTRP